MLLRSNRRSIALVGTISLLTFLYSGWAATRSHLLGVNFVGFDPTVAVTTLGAVAQIVLAFAVFEQISAAKEAVSVATQQAASQEREARGSNMAAFVSAAGNASARYHVAAKPFHQAVAAHFQGGATPAEVAYCRELLERAEDARQDAYAAHSRVVAREGASARPTVAARELMKVINKQHSAGLATLELLGGRGGENRSPELETSSSAEREQCLAEAHAIFRGERSLI